LAIEPTSDDHYGLLERSRRRWPLTKTYEEQTIGGEAAERLQFEDVGFLAAEPAAREQTGEIDPEPRP
jgi:hypothetical protein